MDVISGIRSTKAELNITPKLSCDIIFSDKSKLIKKLIKQNFEIIKQVGRINNFSETYSQKSNIIEIIVLKEKLALKFNEDIDMVLQKDKIIKKLKTLESKISNLRNKLENKAYLKNAPIEIVRNDKDLLRDLSIEENKLRSIVSSIN